jgi:preprotein translocase subunit SecA
LLHTPDLSLEIADFRHAVAEEIMRAAMPPGSLPEQWNAGALGQGLARYFGLDLTLEKAMANDDVSAEEIERTVLAEVDAAWARKQGEMPADVLRHIERSVLLQNLDRLWRQHLQSLDFLRKGINWRGYAQKDPINEFARESYLLFEDLLAQIRRDTVGMLSRVQLVVEEAPPPMQIVSDPALGARTKKVAAEKPVKKVTAKVAKKAAPKKAAKPARKPAAKKAPAKAAKKPAKKRR